MSLCLIGYSFRKALSWRRENRGISLQSNRIGQEGLDNGGSGDHQKVRSENFSACIDQMDPTDCNSFSLVFKTFPASFLGNSESTTISLGTSCGGIWLLQKCRTRSSSPW